MTEEVLSFDTMQIMEMIPHRYPFLLVDRITECVPGKYAMMFLSGLVTLIPVALFGVAATRVPLFAPPPLYALLPTSRQLFRFEPEVAPPAYDDPVCTLFWNTQL